jgi:hypothetical protein
VVFCGVREVGWVAVAVCFSHLPPLVHKKKTVTFVDDGPNSMLYLNDAATA